jgi:hypothetical protein
MKIYEVLEKALERLWDGVGDKHWLDEYICFAIESATYNHADRKKAVYFLKTYGMSATGSWFTRESLGADNSPKACQARRAALLRVAIKHAKALKI